MFASGQTAEALTAYEAALKIVPDDLKALRLRTLALLEQEKYDDVLAASDAFLAKGKPSADLLEIRGQARLARKDFGGAIGDYTVALSLDPGSPALLNHRGWAYLFCRRLQAGPGRFRRGDHGSIPPGARLQRPGTGPRQPGELARCLGRCRDRRPAGLGDAEAAGLFQRRAGQCPVA